MTIVKTLRILPEQNGKGLTPRELRCAKSAYTSLRYEKSVILSHSEDTDNPDFILLATPGIPRALHQNAIRSNAKIIGNIGETLRQYDHVTLLPEGATIHCYTTHDGVLITAQYLPPLQACRELDLSTVLNAASGPVEALASELQNVSNMRGAWHFQIGNGGLTINVMPWPDPVHTQLFCALGINWYALMIFEAMGKPVSILRPRFSGTATVNAGGLTKLYTPFKQAYLDLDDTLIVHDAVNPHVMKFLLACNKKKVEVHLITRHFQNPSITLNHYGIDSQLFASIIWITNGTPKSAHINPTNAIFIDDSFQERKEIIKSLKVPSLPPEACGTLQSR